MVQKFNVNGCTGENRSISKSFIQITSVLQKYIKSIENEEYFVFFKHATTLHTCNYFRIYASVSRVKNHSMSKTNSFNNLDTF